MSRTWEQKLGLFHLLGEVPCVKIMWMVAIVVPWHSQRNIARNKDHGKPGPVEDPSHSCHSPLVLACTIYESDYCRIQPMVFILHWSWFILSNMGQTCEFYFSTFLCLRLHSLLLHNLTCHLCIFLGLRFLVPWTCNPWVLHIRGLLSTCPNPLDNFPLFFLLQEPLISFFWCAHS